jgi:hypothetical protein
VVFVVESDSWLVDVGVETGFFPSDGVVENGFFVGAESDSCRVVVSLGNDFSPVAPGVENGQVAVWQGQWNN